MNQTDRSLEIFKGIRCLDNDSVNSTIEYLDSPSAREQRQLIRTLIRKGYTNQQIYSEVNRIFGPQAILRIYTGESQIGALEGGMALAQGVLIYACYRLLKKR